MNCRWYGDKDPPTTCFVERKTHRESWKGEESVKERFTLPEDKMVPYLEGEYTLQQAQRDLKAKARPPCTLEDLSPDQQACCSLPAGSAYRLQNVKTGPQGSKGT